MFNFPFKLASNIYKLSTYPLILNQVKFFSHNTTKFSPNLVPLYNSQKRSFSDEAIFEPSPMSSQVEIKQNIYGSLRRPKAKDKKTKERDRRIPVDWKLSKKYLESQAYKDTYGDYKVWEMYRRNFRGQYFAVPNHTRISCIGDDGFISTSNPCPICRDKYLVLHYENVILLKQFIEPHTGKVIENRRTFLCQRKYEDLLVAIYLAKDYGTLSFILPFKRYLYEEYYHKNLLKSYQRQRVTVEDSALERIKLEPDRVSHAPATTLFPNIFPNM